MDAEVYGDRALLGRTHGSLLRKTSGQFSDEVYSIARGSSWSSTGSDLVYEPPYAATRNSLESLELLGSEPSEDEDDGGRRPEFQVGTLDKCAPIPVHPCARAPVRGLALGACPAR